MEMDLEQAAYEVDRGGVRWLVIDDEPILQWAVNHGIHPSDVQLQLLGNGITPLRYLKNYDALTPTQQMRICQSRVLVCGCGGLGGILVQLLARAGVGWMRVVDGDVFAPGNLNRQLLCDTTRIDRPKAEAAAETIRNINPLIRAEAVPEIMQEHNVGRLVEGMHLVLDALDNLPGRFILARAARRAGIPFIHGAVAGWWGQVTTLEPESPHGLESVYGRSKSRDPAEEPLGVLGPTAAVIGSLQAFEAVRILSGKKPAYSEQLLYFDGEAGRTEMIPRSDLHPG